LVEVTEHYRKSLAPTLHLATSYKCFMRVVRCLSGKAIYEALSFSIASAEHSKESIFSLSRVYMVIWSMSGYLPSLSLIHSMPLYPFSAFLTDRSPIVTVELLPKYIVTILSVDPTNVNISFKKEFSD
jgi:hypothetical protein